MPPNSPDETPPPGWVEPSPVPQMIAQAAEFHRQEADRIAAELPVLQAIQANPPTESVQQMIDAAGIPSPERPAPAQPAPATPAVEAWDDEDEPPPDEYPTIGEALQQTQNEMNEEYQEVPGGFPHPESGELIMTRAQLGRCRKPDIKLKGIRVVSMKATQPPVPGWWAGFGLGYAEDKAHAAVFNYAQIMDLSPGMNDTYLYVQYASNLVAAEEKKGPVRRCDARLVMGGQLFQMLAIAPKNNMFRARAMAVLKEPIPDDCVTLQQIVDWVEFNFPKTQAANDTSLDLMFRMNYRHTETGACRYRRRVNGTYTGRLTKNELIEIVRSNPEEDFDEIMRIIRQHCEDVARRDGVAHYERVEELDHMPDEFTDHDSEMMTTLRGPVTSILREVLSPEEIDQLGI